MSLEKNLMMTTLLDKYSGLLSANQNNIMNEYYFEDKTLSEIAENFGISRQAVLDAVKKSEEKLSEYESILKLNQKTEEIQRVIERFKNDEISKSDFICDLQNKIREI